MSQPIEDNREPLDSSPPAGTRTGTKTRVRPHSRKLPPYKVLLHNDDVNEVKYVVHTIMELTHMGKLAAVERTYEAHHHGVSLLLVTHKERAELYVDQFQSKGLKVSMEPA